MGEVFNSQRDVARYLGGLGYKVSKSKLNRDLLARGIKKGDGGTYPKQDILEYAATLERKGDDGVAPAELQAQKTAKELEILDLKKEKMQFDMDRERGKFIPRSDFELELAARAVIFGTGVKHAISVHIGEWIALVGGHPDKGPDLLDSMNRKVDEELNRYASQDQYQVLFLDQEVD